MVGQEVCLRQGIQLIENIDIPLSRLPALLVKFRNYLNVEGRIVFSLDHLRYVATRKSIFIGAKGWVGKARYLFRRL